MTNKEKELFQIIYEEENPQLALIKAINTILLFLEQHESFEVPSLVDSQVLS